ncbi:hypothetical protein L596_012389 [Steinernema carpocapsae]|uniref:Uncharacterized protein n=1 Tax=Steinernema carpocapsae TaxID=34508 RepID=A0A4U5NWW5_STECR|nr:hypothetical protein L596_012331 [Steinernema carpocapsae]TKR88097.1 hypothetical protein L596_012389 [Steinernema carpocapsae]
MCKLNCPALNRPMTCDNAVRISQESVNEENRDTVQMLSDVLRKERKKNEIRPACPRTLSSRLMAVFGV